MDEAPAFEGVRSSARLTPQRLLSTEGHVTNTMCLDGSRKLLGYSQLSEGRPVTI